MKHTTVAVDLPSPSSRSPSPTILDASPAPIASPAPSSTASSPSSSPPMSSSKPSAMRTSIPVGAHHVLPHVDALVHDPDSELRPLASQMPPVQHLLSVPGIGPLTATALVAFVGDVRRFPSGRHFASFLGLTPREHFSGHSRRLGHITKRGDAYLRMLLIHGARSVLWAAKARKDPDPLRAWALKLEQHRGHNVAAVALANKLARFAWTVWKEDGDFRLQP